MPSCLVNMTSECVGGGCFWKRFAVRLANSVKQLPPTSPRPGGRSRLVCAGPEGNRVVEDS